MRQNKSKSSFTNQKKKDKYNKALLSQNEKLISIGLIATSIIHEINNPLAYVFNNFELLKTHFESLKTTMEIVFELIGAIRNQDLNKENELLKHLQKAIIDMHLIAALPEIKDILNDTSEGLERIKEISKSLINFMHFDAHEKQEVNINDCIEKALKLASFELKHKCTIYKNLSKLPSLKCYSGAIEQIFLNLFINAAHAIKEKGTIVISSLYTEGQIKVEIADDGQGIKEEDLPNLFQPFFHMHHNKPGLGLGLYIAAKIIHKHHGKISVKSQKGTGTCFTVILPIPSKDKVAINDQ